MSSHEWRVKKRRMCQALHIRADLTTMAQLREAWAAEGLRWPKDDELMDCPEFVNLDDFKKENTMTTKKTAATKTATTKKENTMIVMPENFRKLNLAARINLHNEWYAIVSAAVDEPAAIEVKHACPNKELKNLTDEPIELEFLPYVAAYFGWDDDEFCSETQAKACGGVLKDGAQGWPILWATKTTKAGKASTFCNFIYPKSAFEWTNDEPEVDEDALADKELDALIRAANRAIKKVRDKAKEMNVKVEVRNARRVKPAAPKETKAKVTSIDDIDPKLLAAIKAAIAAA